MSGSQTPFARRSLGVLSRIAPDRRRDKGGFAFKIEATHHKREQIAAPLTWLANRAEFADAAERRHERIAVSNTVSQLTPADGVALACKGLDVSISDASIKTPVRSEIGTEVTLGKLRARVMRHPPQGFGDRHSEAGSAAALFQLRRWAG